MINDLKGDAINCNELGNQITVWEKKFRNKRYSREK